MTSPAVRITLVTNLWPSIGTSSPAAGAYFVAPATVILHADAVDADGSVTKVEFLASNKFGQVSSTPFELMFNNIPAGTYTVMAKATDSEGAVGTSVPVTFTVLPENSPPLIFGQPQSRMASLGSEVAFSIQAVGPPPLRYQ